MRCGWKQVSREWLLRSQGYRIMLLVVMLLLRAAAWRDRKQEGSIPRNLHIFPRFDLGLFRHEAGAVMCHFTR